VREVLSAAGRRFSKVSALFNKVIAALFLRRKHGRARRPLSCRTGLRWRGAEQLRLHL